MNLHDTCPHCGASLTPPETSPALAGTVEIVLPGTVSASGDGPDPSSSGILRIAPDPLLALVARDAPIKKRAPMPISSQGPGLSVLDASPSGIWPGLASADDHRATPAKAIRPPRWPVALLAAYAFAATLVIAWLLWGGVAAREARKATAHPPQASP